MQKTAQVAKLDRKATYAPPSMKKHEPIKIVQGTGGGCGGYLYYVSLYYSSLYYTYYY